MFLLIVILFLLFHRRRYWGGYGYPCGHYYGGYRYNNYGAYAYGVPYGAYTPYNPYYRQPYHGYYNQYPGW